jgi:hypothetical protein
LLNAGSTWPANSAYVCKGTTNTQQSALNFNQMLLNAGMAGWLGPQLKTFYVPKFYLYDNVDDANAELPSGAIPLTVDAGGVTEATVGGGYPPAFSVIVENTGIKGAIPVNDNNATMHEIGHWLDYIAVSKTSNTKDNFTSDSDQYTTELNYDIKQFNLMGVCSNNGVSNGVFSNQTDVNGAYICSGVGGGGDTLNSVPGYKATMTNWQIFQKAWPAIGKPGDYVNSGGTVIAAPNREIFAEINAVAEGAPLTANGFYTQDDWYFGGISGEFQCVTAVEKSLWALGTLNNPAGYPGKTGLPTNCPALPAK